MMSKRKPRVRATPASVHQLKITLSRSKPPIWRRIEVASDARLSDLHWVIQVVMGWTNSHMHQFVARDVRPKPTRQEARALGNSRGLEELIHRMRRRDRLLSDPEYELNDTEDEFAVTLKAFAPTVKSAFVYEYDFGDSWEHKVEVLKIGPPQAGVQYPRCLAGKLACPPEDCGGLWGYYDLLAALRDPKHARHDELVEWAGEEFDPEHFDLAEINATLAELR